MRLSEAKRLFADCSGPSYRKMFKGDGFKDGVVTVTVKMSLESAEQLMRIAQSEDRPFSRQAMVLLKEAISAREDKLM